ncbi:Hypothetical protein CINCED_3A022498 [Cinara cedri]|uniref:Uncharacterized protein n=1 Tax=Cinara cedri TaxID=506608 RepID=A0A5E4NHQ7_9HEMI|nr:Hypothetical protein CINCED_3A022498 [Cinara cedri]
MTISTPCFFGLTNVRIGTRIIAFVQFWLQLLCLSIIITNVVIQDPLQEKNPKETVNTSHYSPQTINYKAIQSDYYVFLQIASGLVNLYACFYLKKATYSHNLQYINFWMILDFIYYIVAVVFIIYSSFKVRSFSIFFVGLIGSAFDSYKLFVVYLFYLDELSPERLDVDRNNRTQNSMHNGIQSYPHTVDIGTDNNRI